MMSRNRWNLVVDALAYLAMLGLVATGLTMAFRLPPGSGGRHGSGGLRLLGLSRHDWGDIHSYLAYGLLALLALHIVLHWKWVTNTFGALVPRKESRRPGAGRAGAVLLAGLGLLSAAVIAAPLLISLEAGGAGHGYRGGRGARASSKGHGRRGGQQALAVAQGASQTQHAGKGHSGHGDHVRGRTTLAEAAAAGGITVRELAAKLNLPASTPADSRLGPLSHEGGFSMHDVREAVGVGDGAHGGGCAKGSEAPCEKAAARGDSPTHSPSEHGQSIRGRTTLAEAAALAGVSVQRLAAELKLPADTPGDSRLGHLRNEHGFSMHDLRDLVERLKAPKPQ